MKKFLALILAAVMLAALLPTFAFADEIDITISTDFRHALIGISDGPGTYVTKAYAAPHIYGQNQMGYEVCANGYLHLGGQWGQFYNAYPDYGYKFVEWQADGEPLSGTGELYQNATVTAKIVRDENKSILLTLLIGSFNRLSRFVYQTIYQIKYVLSD